MKKLDIRYKITLMSLFATLFANIVGAFIATNISRVFIFEETIEYIEVLSQAGWISNLVAFGFAFIALVYNFYPIFQKNATVEDYRKRVLSLPVFVAVVTLTAWILALLVNFITIYYYDLDISITFLISSFFGTASIGTIAFVLSYFYQDYFNRRYLIPELFENNLEAYKAVFQPSIKIKFLIFYKALLISPMMFFAWIFFWIYSQNDIFTTTQIWYLSAYAVFAIYFGLELTILFSKTFHEPLMKAKYATQKIQDGHYDVELDVISTDELGVLSERINNMAKTLQEDKNEILALNREIEDTQKEVVFTMGAIGESRSKETGNHVKRVAEYSKLLALKYGLPYQEAELLKQASPMHDIGKVAIPDSILNKPGKFTPEEFEVMKTHALLGYEMLKHSDRALLKAAAIVANEHHEKYDGTGYPNKISGEDIHIYGRITAVADVFDALGSDRVYKSAWEDEKIFALFKEESGKHFDPKLVSIFFANIDEILAIRDTYKDNFEG